MVTLTAPESQIVEWVQHLTPTVKQTVLRALIPTLDDMSTGHVWQRASADCRCLARIGLRQTGRSPTRTID